MANSRATLQNDEQNAAALELHLFSALEAAQFQGQAIVRKFHDKILRLMASSKHIRLKTTPNNLMDKIAQILAVAQLAKTMHANSMPITEPFHKHSHK